MGIFQYYEPTTLPEASALLLSLGSKATLVAGGTDVVVRMNKGVSPYEHVINLKNIKGLNYIKTESDSIRIGALTKLSAILDDKNVESKLISLYEAIKTIGTPHIRNLGTMGGNICNASPCADSVPPLVCLNAKIVVGGKGQDREIAAQDFFLAPGKNALIPGEILKEIVIPIPNANTKQTFAKIGPRKSADIAIVNVAASMIITNGVCSQLKIALGSVAPTVIRPTQAEILAENIKVDKVDAVKIGEIASQNVKPITDVRGTIEYRKDMVAVLVERAVQTLLSNEGGL